MFKLVLIGLVFVGISEAAISSLQLVVPDDTYNILTGGKSSTNTLDNEITAFSNAISEEDKSSKALSEESNESVASSHSAHNPTAVSTASPDITVGSAPAALIRAKPSAALSVIASKSGLARGSFLITSSAQASATANAPSSPTTASSTAVLPIASARSTATIQHRILPAEAIPLPITISTRPGLRTVIAPETITIQQPGVARVGEIVQQIPTAVSHQRQTVVHNHARVVTPIVAPAVRTLTSQIVRAYHTPLIYAPHVVEN